METNKIPIEQITLENLEREAFRRRRALDEIDQQKALLTNEYNAIFKEIMKREQLQKRDIIQEKEEKIKGE